MHGGKVGGAGNGDYGRERSRAGEKMELFQVTPRWAVLHLLPPASTTYLYLASLKKAAGLINGLEAGRFSKILTRIMPKLHLKVTRTCPRVVSHSNPSPFLRTSPPSVRRRSRSFLPLWNWNQRMWNWFWTRPLSLCNRSSITYTLLYSHHAHNTMNIWKAPSKPL